MSEKVDKRLRRLTAGTSITRAGMRAVKRAYYATQRRERPLFDVAATISVLQRRELRRCVAIQAQRAAVASYEAAERRHRRRPSFLMRSLWLALLGHPR